jgi:hypothetical protein
MSNYIKVKACMKETSIFMARNNRYVSDVNVAGKVRNCIQIDQESNFQLLVCIHVTSRTSYLT